MTPVILLASTCWWHSVPRMALSLSDAGCDVSAIYPGRGHPLEAITTLKKRFLYRHKDPLQALTDAITELNPDLVVPCDDRSVLHLQQLYALQRDAQRQSNVTSNRITELIERSIGQPDAFETARARHALISVAKSAGIAAPESAELRTSQDLDRWLSQHGLPTVLKVDGSWGGNGVFVVESATEAHQVFKTLSQPLPICFALKRRIVNRDPYWFAEARHHRTRCVVSAQTYITGIPANCAVFCWQGRVLAGIAVEVLQTRYTRAPATLVKVVDRPEMLQAASVLVERLQLSGFIGMDFMIDSETDLAQLIEMNPRATPLCHLRLGPDRDLVGALTATLSGLPLSASRVTTSNVIAYFPEAARVNAAEIPPEAYHDIPIGAPELVQELLRQPWPTRSFLAREFDWWVGVVISTRRRFRNWRRPNPAVSEALKQSGGTPAMASVKVDYGHP